MGCAFVAAAPAHPELNTDSDFFLGGFDLGRCQSAFSFLCFVIWELGLADGTTSTRSQPMQAADQDQFQVSLCWRGGAYSGDLSLVKPVDSSHSCMLQRGPFSSGEAAVP